MNLFVLDKNPRKAAKAHGDKHVIKMVLEACQMLYTAHWVVAYPGITMKRPDKTLLLPSTLSDAPFKVSGLERAYRPAHVNHPCTIWIRESTSNYIWAAQLALALADEYEYRWPGKVHGCRVHAEWLFKHIPNIPIIPHSRFAVAMDDEYKVGDEVTSYRTYYIKSKATKGLTLYTKRAPPEFLEARTES